MNRFSANCHVRIGNGFHVLPLKSDHDTRDQAMQAAVDKWGPHARAHIMIYRFVVESTKEN